MLCADASLFVQSLCASLFRQATPEHPYCCCCCMSGDVHTPRLTGVKDLSAKISTHAADTQKTAPTASELAEQVRREVDRSDVAIIMVILAFSISR